MHEGDGGVTHSSIALILRNKLMFFPFSCVTGGPTGGSDGVIPQRTHTLILVLLLRMVSNSFNPLSNLERRHEKMA